MTPARATVLVPALVAKMRCEAAGEHLVPQRREVELALTGCVLQPPVVGEIARRTQHEPGAHLRLAHEPVHHVDGGVGHRKPVHHHSASRGEPYVVAALRLEGRDDPILLAAQVDEDGRRAVLHLGGRLLHAGAPPR